jgi:hypothetical protein
MRGIDLGWIGGMIPGGGRSALRMLRLRRGNVLRSLVLMPLFPLREADGSRDMLQEGFVGGHYGVGRRELDLSPCERRRIRDVCFRRR